jgi:type VII secretion protein EccB
VSAQQERRPFASRTPASGNPDPLIYRRGFVTSHQVTGWRFITRRIASAVALHDARMLVDPLRTQTRSIGLGALLAAGVLIGCFVFSLIRPAGVAGESVVLADRSTAALYVRVGEYLHPVLNLASARLIAGKAVDPTMVKSTELDRFPRGNLIGIPGAPERLAQSSATDADWTVCESSADRAVTVIAGPPASGADKASALPKGRAAVVASESGSWLLWDGRRSALDLSDTAVTSALGIDGQPEPRPVTERLVNTVPESPALTMPAIAGAGTRAPYPLPVAAPVGSVLISYSSDGAVRQYAVLSDGVQRITPVVASILRNDNSYGLARPPKLTADQIARLPVSSALDLARFPQAPLSLVSSSEAPTLCARFTKGPQAVAGSWSLLAGSVLPLASAARPVQLVGHGQLSSSASSPTRIAVPPGAGYLVQPVGGGGYQWISDTGVRYGVDTEADGDKTLAALGLRAPALPIPASVLDLFAPGPALSRADALQAHDALAETGQKRGENG